MNLKNSVEKLSVNFVLGIVLTTAIFVLSACGKKDISESVKVSFSGFNESGILKYNQDEINKEIKGIALKKAGISKEDIGLILSDEKSKVLDAKILDTDFLTKIVQAEEYEKAITYSFDKIEGLSNGDTITFTVKVTSPDMPIKESKKEFKVAGLEKVETISTEEIFKESDYSFTGYNGSGEMKYSSNFSLTDVNNELRNGDQVTLELSSGYLNKLSQSGKKIEGDKSKIIEVTGLKDYSDITNLKESLQKIDQEISKTTREVKRLKTFISKKYDFSNNKPLVNLVSLYSFQAYPGKTKYFLFGAEDTTLNMKDNTLELPSSSKFLRFNMESDDETDLLKQSTFNTWDFENDFVEIKK